MLLGMPMRYSAEALADSICLQLDGDHFKGLFGQHPELARRWMIAIATRLATSQQRLVDLLGIQLAHQAARVTIDEAVDGETSIRPGNCRRPPRCPPTIVEQGRERASASSAHRCRIPLDHRARCNCSAFAGAAIDEELS